jgi:acyl-CoA thioester hydrolase
MMLKRGCRSDNDQYAHMNNSIYYHLFDSIVNTYLIEKCGQDPTSSPLIGLVVSSYCQVCYGPLAISFERKRGVANPLHEQTTIA